jgi:hypothetical protein
MPMEVTAKLLEMLTIMKNAGFKQIDAPLRQIIITNNGFKLVDHVCSFSRDQNRRLELLKDLFIRDFLNSFLEQIRLLDPKTYADWTRISIASFERGSEPAP